MWANPLHFSVFLLPHPYNKHKNSVEWKVDSYTQLQQKLSAHKLHNIQKIKYRNLGT